MQKKHARFTRLRFITDADGGGGAAAAAADDAAAKPEAPVLNEHGFPDETPVAQMSAEHQAAYWKHQSRKHEKRSKLADDDTLDAAQKWRAQQAANQTPDEKAVQDARDAGRREGAQPMLHDAIRGEIRAQRPHMTTEQLDELLEDVALEKFLGTDGRLDTERVTRLADKLAGAPEQGGGTPPEPDPNAGGQALGFVLGATTPPPAGNAVSVDQFRAAEAARYAAQKTNK